MEFLLSLPILFSAIVLALIVAIAILVELENATWASVLVTAALVFIGVTSFDKSWAFIKLNALDILMYSGYYVLAGIVWSLIKWKLYISASARRFNKVKREFLEINKSIGDKWNIWIDYLNDSSILTNNQYGSYPFKIHDEPEDILRKITVNAGEKKGVIISWISYFPMSLAATFLNDPFRRFFSWLFDMLSGIYDRMAKSSVEGLDEGMEKTIKVEEKK